jgi:two-component sensor histidine kinase
MAPILSTSHDVTLDLALAVIAASKTPLLLLDRNMTVIAASASFTGAFGLEPRAVRGCEVFALGRGEWAQPKLRSLLVAAVGSDLEIGPYEMDLAVAPGETRRLVMNAHRLGSGDPETLRLLLTISDVTEIRASQALASETLREKDDLIRQKAILVQEIQHRVANSLQIIASLLMQSARKVQSEETRIHLQVAHHRVLSIASVQRQLAITGSESVALRPYFRQLCDSLGASMIFDPENLVLSVRSDESAVSADTSVSLGLLVTELVINALKHAFPGGRGGTIHVDYSAHGGDWTLSVGDDGVGMGDSDPKPGLGTSIVQALATHLGARIVVEHTDPGTQVSIVHAYPTTLLDALKAPGAV